ncbi:MAG: UDP-N-acetylmuramoyl-L-alanine--D-glutamate ligase [Gemmatimonadales bacterium]|nr:MAG: UDP-N-acetylmuramoyl-L-alanine--D-glutamate ligase [Gemmatimonadales bacterium]
MSTGVAILGLGASGDAAARLALKQGEMVYVSDLKTDPDTVGRAGELRALGAGVDLGTHDVARIASADVVVVSPGIPPHAPVLRQLDTLGVDPVSEPEFAARYYAGPLIAVTGTNGKTTTAALISHLLEAAGIPAALGGNVGTELAPAASRLALLDPPPQWYVLELSSFQLAGIRDLTPAIGVVTSLAPDHLDRYRTLEDYYGDKARLFRNASPESFWVLNAEVDAVRRLPGDAPGIRCWFALHEDRIPEEGKGAPAAFVRDGLLVLRGVPSTPGAAPPRQESVIREDQLPILGRHNTLNALAAALTARLAGASLEGIRRGLESFRPLPHRMEPVADAGGVLWVNDSKATNVEATRGALESLRRTLVVILGGKDKGEGYGSLAPALEARSRAVILYGAAAPRMARELVEAGLDPARIVSAGGGFDEAVVSARDHARPGDLVLLSPACSSFDAFPDYRARGERFTHLARRGGSQGGPS